jgi:hypothetical protein
MTREIRIAPLTGEAFAPFGEVLEATGTPDRIINGGLCGRFHDRAVSISLTAGPASASSNPRRGACPTGWRWWNATRSALRHSCR